MNKFKDIKIGVMGCGYWATNIIKSLEEENFKNVYAFDFDKKKLINAKSNFFFLQVCNSLNEILSKKLDCVLLVTPTSTHYSLGKAILKKNINLFIEKPGTLKSQHLKELINISKKKKLKLMSGYIYIYNTYIQYIKKIINKKKLGNIKYIYFERSNLGPIRNDTSCLWDLASHDLSTAMYLLKNKPKISYVRTYNFLKKKFFDISSVGLDFKKTKVEIRSSWLNPEKIRKIIIIGEKKMLQFDEMEPINKIKIYNKYASYPDIKKFNKSFFTPKANIYLGKTHVPKIKFISPMKEELMHFFHSVKNNKNPITSGSYALKVIQLLEEIEKHIN